MKSFLLFLLLMIIFKVGISQCSLCTKTAQQLGPQAATGMNGGILYMMGIVLGIVVLIIYFMKKNKVF